MEWYIKQSAFDSDAWYNVIYILYVSESYGKLISNYNEWKLKDSPGMSQNHGEALHICRHERCLTQCEVEFSCQSLDNQNFIQAGRRVIECSQGILLTI